MNILNLINEEIIKFINENNNEEIDWDLYDKLNQIKHDILSGFFADRQNGVTEQPWKLIPFHRLKKIWEDFMTMGIVRDVRGLETIEDIITDNILKLYVNTELVGHTQYDPDDDFDEYSYSEEDIEQFNDYISKFSDYAFNDFGGKRLGLLTLLGNLRKTKTPEEKVPIIDQMLNVVHQRSDLASWFVEGGSKSLSQLSGSPSEV